MTEKQFDFGSNWQAFSRSALSVERVEQARRHFADLLDGVELQNRSFLDIGFGQGLSLLAATAEHARTVGCDINPLCARVLEENRARWYASLGNTEIPVVVGSILDPNVVRSLQSCSPDAESYDIVHSWGVLHHTGDMATAIRHAASLVSPGGYLIIAIYNRHWSSGAWWAIKRFYNYCPSLVRRLLIGLFYPIIFVAKWLVTRRNPLRLTRGMDFFYDVVDWVGGYPYEFGSVEEIDCAVEALSFTTERVLPAEVPTGCNQFVFKRRSLE